MMGLDDVRCRRVWWRWPAGAGSCPGPGVQACREYNRPAPAVAAAGRASVLVLHEKRRATGPLGPPAPETQAAPVVMRRYTL